MESNSNKVADWLPEGFEETKQLKWFAEKFGSDELLMFSWQGCTLSDPRVARVAQALPPTESGSRLLRQSVKWPRGVGQSPQRAPQAQTKNGPPPTARLADRPGRGNHLPDWNYQQAGCSRSPRGG